MEKLVKESVGVREIGRQLDRCPANISRHLNNPKNQDWFRTKRMIKRRSMVEKRFSAALAIQNQKEKRKTRGRKSKIPKDDGLKRYLEESIKKKRWSPQIAMGYAKKKGMEFKESVTVKTIYNTMYRGEMNVSLFDLFLKLQRKPNKERIIREWKRIFGKRISERPDISDRTEFGHWEIDTVFWGRNFSVLVLVERKTRYCKIIRLTEHTSKEVNEKLEALSLSMKSLTADNGMEFARLIEIFKETYFTHPYSSWEKGSVENLNGLIRRYLPRTTDLNKITQSRLQLVEDEINNLPRPILNFSTAKELYELEVA